MPKLNPSSPDLASHYSDSKQQKTWKDTSIKMISHIKASLTHQNVKSLFSDLLKVRNALGFQPNPEEAILRREGHCIIESIPLNIGPQLNQSWIACRVVLYKRYLSATTSALMRGEHDRKHITPIIKTADGKANELDIYNTPELRLKRYTLEAKALHQYFEESAKRIKGSGGSVEKALNRFTRLFSPIQGDEHDAFHAFLNTLPVHRENFATGISSDIYTNNAVVNPVLYERIKSKDKEVLTSILQSTQAHSPPLSAFTLMHDLYETTEETKKQETAFENKNLDLIAEYLMDTDLQTSKIPRSLAQRLEKILTAMPDAKICIDHIQMKLPNGDFGQSTKAITVNSKPLYIILHTNPNDSDPYFSLVQEQINEIDQVGTTERVAPKVSTAPLSPKEFKDKFMEKLAALVYTMSHVQFVSRGSAGIIQWFMYAMALRKGIELPPLNQTANINFDFMAITSPLSEFKTYFKTTCFEEIKSNTVETASTPIADKPRL
jgi:hypothetical protein